MIDGTTFYNDYSNIIDLDNPIAAPNMFVYIENNKINFDGESSDAVSGYEVYEKMKILIL